MFLAIVIWYLIGSLSCLLLFRKIQNQLTIGDLIICLTLGGFSGLISLVIWLTYIVDNSKKPKWWNKKI